VRVLTTKVRPPEAKESCLCCEQPICSADMILLGIGPRLHTGELKIAAALSDANTLQEAMLAGEGRNAFVLFKVIQGGRSMAGHCLCCGKAGPSRRLIRRN
jgi:hypothetical protein